MKKRWIAEAVYLIAVLGFIGICISSRREQEQEVLETSITKAPTLTQGADMPPMITQEPDVPPTPTQGADVPPTPTQGADVPPTPTQEPDVPLTPTQEPDVPPTPTQGADVPPMITQEPDVPLTPTQEPDVLPTKAPEEPGKMSGAIEIKNENYGSYENESNAWWFIRKTDHSPSGSGEAFPIDAYSAYYLDKEATEEDKVIYLTFDCGYENGYTPAILDTLAKKGVKVMFFVTKDFIVKNPEYVKRMKEEGHLVGNHTMRHLSSPSLTPEELEAELYEVAKTMEEQTGYRLDPFFRPPMGEYSERTLKAAQDMGYASIFWSIAYYDYDVNKQPGKDYVTDHFATYHHNGSIVLMHNISESNTQALGEVLDLLKEAGYRFGALTELTNARE